MEEAMMIILMGICIALMLVITIGILFIAAIVWKYLIANPIKIKSK